MPGGPAATSDLLAGTRWQITSIDGTPAVGRRGPRGRLRARRPGVREAPGCNRFTASYSVTAEYLTFGPLATTRRAGPPELVEQEGRVVQSLAGMCSYRFDGASLLIDGPAGSRRAGEHAPGPGPPARLGVDAPTADQPL